MVPNINYQDPFDIIKSIIKLLKYHRIDTYVYIRSYIYEILKNHIEIFNSKGLYFIINNEINDVFDKNIFSHLIDLDNRYNNNKYNKIIIYSRIPNFIDTFKYDKYTNTIKQLDINNINYWHNKEIVNDMEYLANIFNTGIYYYNFNGTLYDHVDFKYIFNTIKNDYINNLNGHYPYAETIIPSLCIKKNIKVSNIDYTIWPTDDPLYVKYIENHYLSISE